MNFGEVVNSPNTGSGEIVQVKRSLKDSYIDYNVGLFSFGKGIRVLKPELNESFPRVSGDFESNKRHGGMLNKSIVDDTCSGSKEENSAEVCGSSESRQIKKEPKRKLLSEVDPDWSPWRGNVVNEGWIPEYKHNVKSSVEENGWRGNVVNERWIPECKHDLKCLVEKNGGVGDLRPVIQGLPSVKMLNFYWNQGGDKNKIEPSVRRRIVPYIRKPTVQASAAQGGRGNPGARGDNENRKDSIEEDVDTGVSKPTIIALPAPYSFKDFCKSAGWTVTLPKGVGTTIYSSPTGCIYESLSKVVESFSQQASKLENAQSKYCQSVDNSKPGISSPLRKRRVPMKTISVTEPIDSVTPEKDDNVVQSDEKPCEIDKSVSCRRKRLIRKFTTQINIDEEVSHKHKAILAGEPNAGKDDNRVTDMKAECESLNNEKSSSECGSVLTTKSDCDKDLRSPRRSKRIKGRRVAVDFDDILLRETSTEKLDSRSRDDCKQLGSDVAPYQHKINKAKILVSKPCSQSKKCSASKRLSVGGNGHSSGQNIYF